MQTLNVKVRGSDGTETTKKVTIIRSWQDASGKQVYLHSGGLYGFKDGSPVRFPADLDVISDPIQHQVAMNWWDRRGKALSGNYYQAVEKRLRKLAGDFQPDEGGADSEKDRIHYIRKSLNPKSKAKKQSFAWLELFPARPDWWGQANMIILGDWVYEMERDEPAAVKATDADVDTGEKTPPAAAPESSDTGDTGIGINGPSEF